MPDAESRRDRAHLGGPGRDDWVDWVTGLGLLLASVGVINGLVMAVRERASLGLAWTIVSGVLLVLVLLANRAVRAIEGDD